LARAGQNLALNITEKFKRGSWPFKSCVYEVVVPGVIWGMATKLKKGDLVKVGDAQGVIMPNFHQGDPPNIHERDPLDFLQSDPPDFLEGDPPEPV
jgi:hypothetical protein